MPKWVTGILRRSSPTAPDDHERRWAVPRREYRPLRGQRSGVSRERGGTTMSLLVKASREGPLIVRVTPDSAGWKYVGFSAYRLPAGGFINFAHPGHEQCIVVLAGTVTIKRGGETWRDLGERQSGFEDRAP